MWSFTAYYILSDMGSLAAYYILPAMWSFTAYYILPDMGGFTSAYSQLCTPDLCRTYDLIASQLATELAQNAPRSTPPSGLHVRPTIHHLQDQLPFHRLFGTYHLPATFLSSRLTTHYSLLTFLYSLSTTHYLTTSYPLSHYLIPTISLPHTCATYHPPLARPVAVSPFAWHLPLAGYISLLTAHYSLLTFLYSLSTTHLSHYLIPTIPLPHTCYLLPTTCYLPLHTTDNWQGCRKPFRCFFRNNDG